MKISFLEFLTGDTNHYGVRGMGLNRKMKQKV